MDDAGFYFSQNKFLLFQAVSLFHQLEQTMPVRDSSFSSLFFTFFDEFSPFQMISLLLPISCVYGN